MDIAKDDFFEQAAKAHAEGRLDEAAVGYEACLTSDPDDAVAMALLGAVRTLQGRAPEGRALLERSVEIDPDNEVAWLQLGLARQSLADHEGCVEAIEQARLRRMPFPESVAPLAHSLSALRRFDTIPDLALEVDASDAGWRDVQLAAVAACLACGRLEEAELRSQVVLSRFPGDSVAVAQLITRCLAEPAPHGIIEHLRRLKREWHDNPSILAAIAEQFGLLGLLEEAESCWTRHIELAPADPTGPYQLARILSTFGRLEEASRSVERSLTLSPRHSDAWLMLSQIKRISAGDPLFDELTRIENELPAYPEREQCNFHFAIAQIRDSNGDHDRAFEHLVRGSALHRKRQPSDVEELLAVERAILSGASPQQWKSIHHPSAGHGPILVVGMPRSGTTLTERILSRHPRVQGVGELTIAPQLINRVGYARVLDEVRLSSDGRVPPAVREFADEYVEAISSLSGPDLRTCDKQPHNYRLLGPLATGISTASIIHCVRDPRDIAVSCYQAYFLEQPWSFDLRDIGRCLRSHHQLMRHWHDCLPDRIITVEYERLVSEPEIEIPKLLERVGLEFDDRCLSPQDDRGAVGTVSFAQVRRRINSNSVGRWRRYERHLEPLLDEIADIIPS